MWRSFDGAEEALAARSVEVWMNSPGHRANILNPDFTRVGVGVAHTSTGAVYLTQNFWG